jgi:thiamine-monophosphate kinase
MTPHEPRGERAMIERIRTLLPRAGSDVLIGPGDDCAAIASADGGLLLLTCDVLVEDRHFTRASIGPRDLGRRLAAVNLSDIAAMGGEPTHALASLVLPQDLAPEWSLEITRGISEELARFGALLIGGNLSGTGGGIVADLTLLGRVERDRVLRRSGARAGDAILVTGALGGSAAGLHVLAARSPEAEQTHAAVVAIHRRPRPRVREGRTVARSGRAHAMIDLSDGLATDLAHVCRESGVGAEIDLAALPVLDETRAAAAALGLELQRLVLSCGEDYELLFTADEADAAEIAREVEAQTGTRVTRIGRILEAGRGLRYVDAAGNAVPKPAPGWDHFG